MKPFLYSILFYLSINIINSQSKELVLKNSFNIDKNTVLNLDVDNVSINFQETKENKVTFGYYIIFKDNSEETKYNVFKEINANVSRNKNSIYLKVKNSMLLGELHDLDVDIEIFKNSIKDFYFKKKKNKLHYKSKDSVLKEIKFSSGHDFDDYFKKLKIKYPNKDFGNGSKKFKQEFTIKAPKTLILKIKALHSKIYFNYNIETPIEFNSFKSYLKFKTLTNSNNKFSLHSGIFQSEKVVGGTYFFKDVSKVIIGSISNANLETETSKIQIGEIGENISISDFNSKFRLYNFSNEFDYFNLKGEYSQINLFKVNESNYTMNIFGFNTVLNLNKVKTTFPLTKEKKMIKILEKKQNKGKDISGNIEMELKNGVLNIK